jgi:hypothetical protein
VNFIFVFNNKLREGVFWTFGIPKPSYFSWIELVMKKRSSTMKGLLLGVFFSAEGPQDKGIIGKVILRTLSLPKVLEMKILSGSYDDEYQSHHRRTKLRLKTMPKIKIKHGAKPKRKRLASP